MCVSLFLVCVWRRGRLASDAYITLDNSIDCDGQEA